MKHSSRITLWLISLFVLTQVVGLLIIVQYIDVPSSVQAGEINWQPLPYDFERPEVENQSTSFIPLIVAILLGTGIVMLIIKWGKALILKIWFFLVIWITLLFAFGAFLPSWTSVLLATLLSVWRTWRPNTLVHNVSELFIYGGLAAIIVPIFNVFAGLLMLLFISVYDMIAVWKIKHMITMAKFQTESKMFAGLFLPYEKGAMHHQPARKNVPKKKVKIAVLGGGDMGFPLIFSGIVLKDLVLTQPVAVAFAKTLFIPFFTTVALAVLLYKGESDKFYPAMPFLSLGCLLGYGAVLLF